MKLFFLLRAFKVNHESHLCLQLSQFRKAFLTSKRVVKQLTRSSLAPFYDEKLSTLVFEGFAHN